MLDVTVFAVAINVIDREHIYEATQRTTKLLELAGTDPILSITYKLANLKFQHPTLPKANELQHFALWYQQRATPSLA
jgi:hypothetical protein